jgi:DNA-binding HxlR family transcriptional regulator
MRFTTVTCFSQVTVIMVAVMRSQPRSDCPINYALELFGDRWTLLIVRDMLYEQMSTFGELASSPEGIATNVLTERLGRLEANGIVTKSPDATDGRRDRYALTEKGIQLYPVMLEMTLWSATWDPATVVSARLVAIIEHDKPRFIQEAIAGRWRPPHPRRLTA